MTFSVRLSRAEEHEKNVVQWLIDRGHRAYRFGQGLLPPECRDDLKRFKTPVRWLPDIIAFSKSGKNHGYVDAKTGRLDTENHSIETDAIKTANAWTLLAEVEQEHYFFVWENYDVATLQMVNKHAVDFDGTWNNGSGTPFRLLKKTFCLKFDLIFGESKNEKQAK